jgi:hypothetical protein
MKTRGLVTSDADVEFIPLIMPPPATPRGDERTGARAIIAPVAKSSPHHSTRDAVVLLLRAFAPLRETSSEKNSRKGAKARRKCA